MNPRVQKNLVQNLISAFVISAIPPPGESVSHLHYRPTAGSITALYIHRDLQIVKAMDSLSPPEGFSPIKIKGEQRKRSSALCMVAVNRFIE